MTTGRARAVVVGGGLGGLTAAAALHRVGWQVDVLEQAPSMEPVGAGIAVAPNALRALDVLGVGQQVRDRSALQGPGGFRAPDGRWLLRLDLTAVTAELGDPAVVLPRAVLVDLLRAQLPAAAVRLGTTVTAVEPGDGSRAAVVHTGGPRPGRVAADLVVVADGARSRLRPALFPGHPGLRYAGYTAWRFLLDAADGGPGDRPCGPFETWGRGQRFSALPMADGAMYCWATATVPAGGQAADERAELIARFGRWHAPVPQLIRQARSVLRHDAVELARPLPPMHVGRTALLGDAAHAMTPDLGQGGCMAMEDAVVLAHAVRSGLAPGALTTDAATGTLTASRAPGVPDALARYSAARLPRTTRLARQSRQVGRTGQAGGALVTALRDRGLRAAGHLPPGLLARALTSTAGWQPPAAADAP